MGIRKLTHSLAFTALVLSSCSTHSIDRDDPLTLPDFHSQKEIQELPRVLYLVQEGKTREAVKAYIKYHKETGLHDFELLYQMAQSILYKGANSLDSSDHLRAIYGSGITMNTQSIPILEQGINSPNPQAQLASINFLARLQDDNADELLERALSSRNLLVRLESAFYLASKKKSLGQIDALMHKVDSDIRPLFPQLFAMIGSTQAIDRVKYLLADSDPDVRLAAILSVMEYQRDDLLPLIRTLSTQHDIAHQEACAFVFATLKDGASIENLKILSRSPAKNVQLAAWKALYQMGHRENRHYIEQMAKEGSSFAIVELRDIDESKDTLYDLANSPDLQVRTNATISLLEQRDSHCVSGLLDILIKDSRDLAFLPQFSIGRGTVAWKAIPSAHQNLRKKPFAFELSLKMREEALRRARDLPEKDFLLLAHALFQSGQTQLIPSLVVHLEAVQSDAAINLLKKYQQKPGSPLTRDYCNLSLFRLKEEGPYTENLRKWLQHYQDTDLINFRTFIPWKLRPSLSPYELTPEETSGLIIETCSALADSHDEQSVETLLQTLSQAKSQNQFALAGLIIR
ncbi:MAG: HEAT repeat protein, partial [Chlamydiales bacterium]